MTERWLDGNIPELDDPQESDLELEKTFSESVEAYTKAMNSLQFSVALEAMFVLVRKGNKYIDINQPWRIAKTGTRFVLAASCAAASKFRVAGLAAPIHADQSTELLERLKSPSLIPFNSTVLSSFSGHIGRCRKAHLP